jgi:hypothetical protein
MFDGMELFASNIYHVLTVSQSALKERGIDKMLEEARDDHKENDAVHLQQKCELSFLNHKYLITNFSLEGLHIGTSTERHWTEFRRNLEV